MVPQYFPALLKTEDDRLLEEGMAYILLEERAVEFSNDFVPLLKLGTRAKIVRIMDDVETHCFIGRTYLSSRELLRIVDVSDSMLAQAELDMAVDITIPARIQPIESVHGPLRPGWVPIDIYSISMTGMKFTSLSQFEVGQRMTVQSNGPVALRGVVVEIYQIISLGRPVTGYRCHILSMPEQTQRVLAAHLEGLNQVFPVERGTLAAPGPLSGQPESASETNDRG